MMLGTFCFSAVLVMIALLLQLILKLRRGLGPSPIRMKGLEKTASPGNLILEKDARVNWLQVEQNSYLELVERDDQMYELVERRRYL